MSQICVLWIPNMATPMLSQLLYTHLFIIELPGEMCTLKLFILMSEKACLLLLFKLKLNMEISYQHVKYILANESIVTN